ncbi:hypothetical protein RugamoR1_49740 [Rugamonas sp. R1(2021)]
MLSPLVVRLASSWLPPLNTRLLPVVLLVTISALVTVPLLTPTPLLALPPPHAVRTANDVAAIIVRIVAEFIAVVLERLNR